MRLTRSGTTIYDSLLALIYPQACAVCGQSVEQSADGVACANCWEQVRMLGPDDALCWKCGAPLMRKPVIPSTNSEEFRCRACDHHFFNSARAGGIYEGALRASVLQLKREPWLCHRLVEKLCDLCSSPPLDRATRVVSVPLHAARQKERGFNQATVIAMAVADKIHLPFYDHSLIRISDTVRHRAGMDARGRQETVKGAFAVPHPLVMQGERILLVDDVYTSGSTASACAGTLLNAGALEVLVLTLAQPLRH